MWYLSRSADQYQQQMQEGVKGMSGVRSFVRCQKNSHTLELFEYQVLCPPQNQVEGVIAVRCVGSRLECTTCVHTELFGKLESLENVEELSISPEDYDRFVAYGKILILEPGNDIIVKAEEK